MRLTVPGGMGGRGGDDVNATGEETVMWLTVPGGAGGSVVTA